MTSGGGRASRPGSAARGRSLLGRVRRSLVERLGGGGLHRLYSTLHGLGYKTPGGSGRWTATERLQHGLLLEDDDIERGRHRRLVGGRWDEIGRLQLEFLESENLRPEHRVVDVGCGALRAGVHLVAYLEPRHYFGIDINPSLIRAGLWELEQAGLSDRCPPENLRVTDSFDCDFGVAFDFAIAQSLFTHVGRPEIERCLGQLALVMSSGGRLYASYNGLPPGETMARPSTRDPFRHAFDDLAAAGEASGWSARYVSDWGHPRGMKMVEYSRPGEMIDS